MRGRKPCQARPLRTPRMSHQSEVQPPVSSPSLEKSRETAKRALWRLFGWLSLAVVFVVGVLVAVCKALVLGEPNDLAMVTCCVVIVGGCFLNGLAYWEAES